MVVGSSPSKILLRMRYLLLRPLSDVRVRVDRLVSTPVTFFSFLVLSVPRTGDHDWPPRTSPICSLYVFRDTGTFPRNTVLLRLYPHWSPLLPRPQKPNPLVPFYRRYFTLTSLRTLNSSSVLKFPRSVSVGSSSWLYPVQDLRPDLGSTPFFHVLYSSYPTLHPCPSSCPVGTEGRGWSWKPNSLTTPP